MYFKIRQRATLVQAPESFSDRYNEGDEVIIETTVDAGVPYTQIVGHAVPKTPSPEAFRPVRTWSGDTHLDAAFSAAGAGLAEHVRVGDRFDKQALSRLIEETNYSLRAKGLAIKPDYKLHGATEFVVKKIDPSAP